MNDGDSVELTDLSDSANAAPAEQQDKQPAAAAKSAVKAAPVAGADPSVGDGGPDAVETSSMVSELEAVYDVQVGIAAVLGRTNMEVSSLLALSEGDVVELDKKVGEAIEIFINNRLIARGEVVLVEDQLGVTMTEIIKGDQTP